MVRHDPKVSNPLRVRTRLIELWIAIVMTMNATHVIANKNDVTSAKMNTKVKKLITGVAAEVDRGRVQTET